MRAETAATFSVLLVLCTPWSNLLKALRVLRLPIVLVVILGMTYRYIFLLLRTAHDMFKSRKSRMVGRLDGREQRRAATASAGVLMSKTLQLSGDVYLAMRSRGFQGEVYVLDEFRTGWFDWIMLAVFLQCGCWPSGWDDERSGNPLPRGRVVTVPIFELRDVTYRYHEVTALDGLNLTIMPGERIALLGANGSGKVDSAQYS